MPRKKTDHYQEQDPEQVEEYLKEIEGIPEEKIAYVDETGLDSYFHP